MLFENIKNLCVIDGISGRENKVAQYIFDKIKPIATEIKIDNIGNVIAFKKGKSTPKNKIMLSAHTDEVGLIVTSICDDGTILFSTVGGINPKVIIGRAVKTENITGVIGAKAIHLLDADEKSKVVEIDKLFIDIGANDKEDAQKHVKLGDSVSFIGNYAEFGDGFIKAKAIDDRAGCAILMEIMSTDLEFDCYFAFSTQEEIGLRGAKVAAYTIKPDVAIVVETTATGDVSGVEKEQRVSVVGDGAVVSYMDCNTMYDKGLFDLSFELAKEKNIKVQTKTKISGGNDAGAIHVANDGVRTIAVSIASKYIHSPANVVKKSDVKSVFEMALALTNAVGNL